MTDRDIEVCTECGEEKMVWFINDETRLCEDCADDLGFVQCDVCGDFYPMDSVDFTELPDGREVCQYCMEDLEE